MEIDFFNKNQILPVWKPLGVSTHVLSTQASLAFGVPVAHTGTIDPLAEGVVILLVGEERFKKIELAGWKKEYEFQITFGLSTDTYDLMGIFDQEDLNFVLHEDKLDEILQKFPSSYMQTYPPFSAKKINGKPLHYYAQLNELHTIELPTLPANIYSLKKIQVGQISSQHLALQAIEKISNVQGFFRQEQIVKQWNSFLQKPLRQLFTSNMCALVSRGVYIRALAVDIGHALGTCAVVSNLIRTKNGEFSQNECAPYQQIIAHLNITE